MSKTWLQSGLLVFYLWIAGCVSSPPVVVEVISPNMLKLNDGALVQYAGLESLPATHPAFAKCQGANAYLVLNKTVRLVEEPALTKDGVLVAYVYTPVVIGQETKYLFVNAELVRFGYAKVMPVPAECQNREVWQSLLDLQEKEARPARRELWSGEILREEKETK